MSVLAATGSPEPCRSSTMPSRFLDGVDDPTDFIDGEYDRQTLRALCPH
jgi:hypothetical protein